MKIYKTIARFGLDSEMHTFIYWNLEAAKKAAIEWFNNEECDSVEIYLEVPEKDGYFRTKTLVWSTKRPF